jgi:hypothetical protein
VVGKTDLIINPAFATSIGLLGWAAREKGLGPGGDLDNHQAGPPRRQSEAFEHWRRRIHAMFRALLP